MYLAPSLTRKLRPIVNHDLFSPALAFVLSILFLCLIGDGTGWIAQLIADGLTLFFRFMLKQ
jgi:hypothetical protein